MKKNIKNIRTSTKIKNHLLNGGECSPLQNPEEDDFSTTNNLLYICPGGKGTFWRKNYNTK